MQTTMIALELTVLGQGADDDADFVPTDVEFRKDGETVALAFPGGVTWNCDQAELEAFLAS
jgi:hypothetical protein